LNRRSVAAIILAAGASTRLGHSKQLVKLGAETLLERAVRLAREAGCEPVVVVLGSDASRILSGSKLAGAMIVVNPDWNEGMASSIRTGLSEVEAISTGVILMVCDQPAVTPEHLRALAATGNTTASEYADRRGVPAYLPAGTFPSLMTITGDAGARDILRTADAIPLPGGELDIDTDAELEDARRQFAP
jgi:molybdenum cofactor cytidylyltransferase